MAIILGCNTLYPHDTKLTNERYFGLPELKTAIDTIKDAGFVACEFSHYSQLNDDDRRAAGGPRADLVMADAATPTTPICNAAFTSLHLDPLGNVRVCELNSLGLLGNIADRSLRELWDGASAQRVRAALRRVPE